MNQYVERFLQLVDFFNVGSNQPVYVWGVIVSLYFYMMMVLLTAKTTSVIVRRKSTDTIPEIVVKSILWPVVWPVTWVIYLYLGGKSLIFRLTFGFWTAEYTHFNRLRSAHQKMVNLQLAHRAQNFFKYVREEERLEERMKEEGNLPKLHELETEHRKNRGDLRTAKRKFNRERNLARFMKFPVKENASDYEALLLTKTEE